MAKPAQGDGSLLARIQKTSPYHKMAEEGLDILRDVQKTIRSTVERERQVAARKRAADVTFQGVDQDGAVTFPSLPGTFGAIRIPDNQAWKCMRVAASSAANDILYCYRGAPQPQNLVERIQCFADGFFVDSFSNDLYMAPGSMFIVQSSLSTAGFHLNLEIERMIPLMLPADADALNDELAQTPLPFDGDSGYGHGTDPDAVAETVVDERHMNPIVEDPQDQPVQSQQDAARQLLPDPSLHLPGAGAHQ